MISLYDEDQIKAAYDRDKIEEGIAKGMARGMEKGMAKGRAEGMEKGMAKGRAEGEMKKARDTAYELQKMGLTIENIAKAVKVNKNVVTKWLSEPNGAPAN